MPLFLLVLAYAAQYVESWKSESGDDEIQSETESLARLVRGLLSRCREKNLSRHPRTGRDGLRATRNDVARVPEGVAGNGNVG